MWLRESIWWSHINAAQPMRSQLNVLSLVLSWHNVLMLHRRSTHEYNRSRGTLSIRYSSIACHQEDIIIPYYLQ